MRFCGLQDADDAIPKLHRAMERKGPDLGSQDFGSLLRRYRLGAGLSQEVLAERAGLSLHGISALERGYRRTPQRETLELLAGALALDADQRRAFEAAAVRTSSPRRRDGASVTVGPWPSLGSANLPLALTRFFGRDAELNQIATLMREHRLVTITGAGGVGKTQTALRAATSSDAAEHGVCCVNLARISDPSLIATAIATALGVQEVPNHPLRETLIAFLKNKTILLVLDNCEHVIAEAASVVDSVLRACPNLRILATSREPLMAAGERTYRLPSLNIQDASALFTDRARAVDVHFELSDENAPIVGGICRRLDGIPLAIELAAARVNVLPLKELVEKLDDRFAVLTIGERTAPPRQQTMRAAIDWSYNLLSEPEQRFFERFSVFAGGCTLQIAAAVCAGNGVAETDVLDLLSSLVDKSLIATDLRANEPRYFLLESFRQYSLEKLAAHGDPKLVAHRHALAFLELKERFRRETFGSIERERRDAPELDNWRAAIQWALTERGDVQLGQRLAAELGCSSSFPDIERRRWVTTALQLADKQTPRSILAALSFSEAYIAENLMEYTAQLESSENALAQYRTLGDTHGVASALSYASYALFCLGRRAEAERLAEEALPLARALEGRKRLSLAYILRVMALAIEDDIISARRCISEAMQIYQAHGELLNLAYSLADLGRCEFAAGNAELALQHATDALATTRPFSYATTKGVALNDMSLYLISLARYDEAKQCARKALELARERSLDILVAQALEHFAAIAALRPLIAAEGAETRERAARILGFVNARLKELGSGRERVAQPQYEEVLATLRGLLGTEIVASLMTEGSALTEDRAIEDALAT